MDRAILHSDINSCYASIERLYRPELGSVPFAVCGSQELRHGIVLAKDERAKRAGVKTGMAIWQARRLCPEIEIVEPHYDRYEKFSGIVRKIYADYTDLCEPFGIDECWLDISGCPGCQNPAAVAEDIRRRVRRETGLTVSVGVSWNKVFAKLGSDYKKPDAVTVIDRKNWRDTVWRLPASDLLMVGRSTARELARMGVLTIGELACSEPELLRSLLGKNGVTLWRWANGMDSSRVRHAGEDEPPQSVGNSVTLPRDIENEAQAKITIIMLADSVGTRLRRKGLRCRSVELALRSAELKWETHRLPLCRATDISGELAAAGTELFRLHHKPFEPLRSMGLRALELVRADEPEQLNIFNNYVNIEKQRSIDRTMDKIREKYGAGSIVRACMLNEPAVRESSHSGSQKCFQKN